MYFKSVSFIGVLCVFFIGVSCVFHLCFEGVSRVVQRCFKCVSRQFDWCYESKSGVFKRLLKCSVSVLFCYSWEIHGCFIMSREREVAILFRKYQV